jgi:hypothetical protein
MTAAIEPRPCSTCWSSRCLAGKEYAPGLYYAHDWANGPMAAAHARWKDERTPPASPEEAIERGLIRREAVTDISANPVTDEPVTDNLSELVTDSLRHCEACNTPFEPKRADARYCSPACRQRAHRRAEASA